MRCFTRDPVLSGLFHEHDLRMPVAGELSANVSSGHCLHKISNLLPMITGAGAKCSLAQFSRTRPALPRYTPPLTLALRIFKELVPPVIRLALFFELREHGCPWQDPLSPKVQSTLGLSSPRWGYQPRWGNGRIRAWWEKNLTFLASMSNFSSFRSSSLPSTTGATYHQILVRCDLSTSPARHTGKNQRFTIAELVFMHQVAQHLRWNATVVSKAF